MGYSCYVVISHPTGVTREEAFGPVGQIFAKELQEQLKDTPLQSPSLGMEYYVGLPDKAPEVYEKYCLWVQERENELSRNRLRQKLLERLSAACVAIKAQKPSKFPWKAFREGNHPQFSLEPWPAGITRHKDDLKTSDVNEIMKLLDNQTLQFLPKPQQNH